MVMANFGRIVSRTYFEAIFRNKYLLLLPILLGLVVGASLALRVEREYVSGASFWADTAVPEESTTGTTGGQAPPAAGQSALLTQLLATRSFLRSVVESSPLAGEYRQLDPLAADLLLGQVAASVAVGSTGPQLVSVTVTRNDPDEARGLTQAVLDQFERERIDFAVDRAQAQLNFSQQVLEAAQGAALEGDDRDTAQRLADAQTAYDASNLALLSAQANGLQVIDQPDLAYPQGRKKTVIVGGVGGMLAGATVALAALILLMARDRSLRSEEEVATALGLETIGSIPDVKRSRRDRAAVSKKASQRFVGSTP